MSLLAKASPTEKPLVSNPRRCRTGSALRVHRLRARRWLAGAALATPCVAACPGSRMGRDDRDNRLGVSAHAAGESLSAAFGRRALFGRFYRALLVTAYLSRRANAHDTTHAGWWGDRAEWRHLCADFSSAKERAWPDIAAGFAARLKRRTSVPCAAQVFFSRSPRPRPLRGRSASASGDWG